MKTYTVFCRHVTGEGTTFIEAVQTHDIEAAMLAGRLACYEAWNDGSTSPNYELDDIECFGIAAGDVEILHWQD
jgi:hypothetical protein